MKRFVLTTALTLAAVAPAFANNQLAGSAGVEAGDYTTAQVIALRAAQQDDEAATANYIRKNGGFEAANVSTKSFGGSDVARDQAIASALASDDRASARALSVGSVNGTVSTKSGISAGHRQLADSLGVDAGDYTVAELVQLKSVVESNNGRGE